jgi:hypothetical protein
MERLPLSMGGSNIRLQTAVKFSAALGRRLACDGIAYNECAALELAARAGELYAPDG